MLVHSMHPSALPWSKCTLWVPVLYHDPRTCTVMHPCALPWKVFGVGSSETNHPELKTVLQACFLVVQLLEEVQRGWTISNTCETPTGLVSYIVRTGSEVLNDPKLPQTTPNSVNNCTLTWLLQQMYRKCTERTQFINGNSISRGELSYPHPTSISSDSRNMKKSMNDRQLHQHPTWVHLPHHVKLVHGGYTGLPQLTFV